jgi:hypothetical protein
MFGPTKHELDKCVRTRLSLLHNAIGGTEAGIEQHCSSRLIPIFRGMPGAYPCWVPIFRL